MSDAPDWQLVTIVESLNRQGDGEIALTLFVHGTVVTGTAIGAAAYYRLQADRLRGAVDGNLDEIFEMFADQVTTENLDPDRDPDEVTLPYFVHLKDADLFMNGQVVSMKGLWRGKIASVDGVTIGRLST